MTGTTDRTLAGLCVAINAGDDSALPALADRLEDLGDPRADGLRRMRHSRPFPGGMGGAEWYWTEHWSEDVYSLWPLPHEMLSPSVFARLRGGRESHPVIQSGHARYYPTRSAAYLALAAALGEGQ